MENNIDDILSDDIKIDETEILENQIEANTQEFENLENASDINEKEEEIKKAETFNFEELKVLLDDNNKKIRKQRGLIALICFATLMGTPVLTYGAMRLGQQRNDGISKENALKTITTQARAEALDTESIAKKAGESVVEILNTSDGNGFGEESVSAGSGVILTTDGYIVTNNHVVKKADEMTVTLKNGEQYEAKLIGTDPRTDLAVIKIDASNLVAAEISDSDEVVVGEPAIAIGNSLGVLGGTVTKGIVSAIDRESNVGTYKLPLIQTDAPVNEGNSGGGLFNESGQLIGIVTQKASGVTVEGLGFAIPSKVMNTIAKELIESGYVKSRPVLGIEISQVSEQESLRYKLDGAGLYVLKSSNEALRRFDLLKEIDGEEIKNISTVLDAIQNKKIGDVVKMKIVREGQEQEVDVTLKASEK